VSNVRCASVDKNGTLPQHLRRAQQHRIAAVNAVSSEAPSPRKALFANRSFRLLVTGGAISMLGDQFTIVAMPWLVLKLTGDPLALGTVLATIALPQAAFILVGGAIVDRFDPRQVLLVARSINAILIGLLCALVATGAIEFWMIYAIALGIGVATAFVYPAGSAILPRMLEPRLLPAANGLLIGLRQLNLFLGPLLAGVLIEKFPAASNADGAPIADAHGIALAFGIDALTFLASIASLLVIRISPLPAGPRERNVLRSIGEGLRGFWRDVSLRSYLLYVSLITLFVGGPVQVGLPLLADARLHWGAASFGTLMSAHGGGVLIGNALMGAGVLSTKGRLGIRLLTIDGIAGLLLAALALVQSTWVGAGLLLALGVARGSVQVAMYSWIQQRVPPERIGRTMSVVMLAFFGAAPLSAVGAGLALRHATLTQMFVAAGLAMVVIALAGTRMSSIRSLRGIDETARPAAS
jgi:MFS family permease